MVEIKPAQDWMVHALYGRRFDYTVEAIVALDGDDVLGMAAIYPEHGCTVMIAKITPKGRACKRLRRAIIKGAHEIIRRAGNWRMPVLSTADPRIPGSREMLEHFGFTQKANDLYELERPWLSPH